MVGGGLLVASRQRWSRVFEPAQGPQKKQDYYTDFCRLQHYFGTISKRDTLKFRRYRPIMQRIVKILLLRPGAGAELTILLAASAASDENFEPKWSILTDLLRVLMHLAYFLGLRVQILRK